MKILFIADGRSPIALNWMRYFCDQEHEVHLVSLFPCHPELKLASIQILPIAFLTIEPVEKDPTTENPKISIPSGLKTRVIRKIATPGVRTFFRHWFVPANLAEAASKLRMQIESVQPDLLHAMRIPYEGMLAALALQELRIPFLVSVWGNDFTLHAGSTPLMAKYTRLVLQRANGLHTDCQRDLHLAYKWGYSAGKLAQVLPGAGGIQKEIFYPPNTIDSTQDRDIVVNPRGLRAYVRSDTFFKSIPLVLSQRPAVRFVCPSMAGENLAEGWVKRLGIEQVVDLLPRQNRHEMADLFRKAKVVISITEHDGTPNTLLEALACGCFPIAGDIEALREWIISGKNGLLVNPASPDELAQAILNALDNPLMRSSARDYNLSLIQEKADYRHVMSEAAAFYHELTAVQFIVQ